jgi:hemoglobin/transferrin/lactoferrin receptor protein
MKKVRLKIVLSAIILTSIAYGAETNKLDVVNLRPILISARGFETAIDLIPGGADVISSEEVQLLTPFSIPNILDLLPGVSKRSDSGWGSDINIRGLSHDSIVFLIDGNRLISATDINGQYGLVLPQSIDRIEVLKGPISSLYGSGTIGGVVNVITKNGYFSDEPVVSGNFFTGFDSNPGGMTMYGNISYNSKDYYLFASGGTRSYESYKDGDGKEMTNSQFGDYETALKGGFRESLNNYTEAQIQYYKGTEIGIPGSDAPFPSQAQVTYPQLHRQLYEIKHTYNPNGDIFSKMSINAFYQFNDRDVRVDLPESMPIETIRPTADHTMYGSKWQNIFVLSDHTFNAGLDFWNRSYEGSRTKYLRNGNEMTDKPLPDAYKISAGAFAEDTWQVTEPLTVNIGGRVDYIYIDNESTPQYDAGHSDDVSWNAHIGSSYMVTEAFSINGILASGYRTPTLTELYKYIILGGGVVKLGNPNLDPEQSLFMELNLNYSSDIFDITLAGFYNDLDNLIVENKVEENLYINENISEAEIYGTELSMNIYISDLCKIYGNIAYTYGKNTITDEYLPTIAPLNGLIGLRTSQFNGFWGLCQLQWAAQQNKTPDNVDHSSSWATVDLRFGYNFEQNRALSKFYIGIDNIFDREYSEYLTASRGFVFNEPGRNFVLGYEVEF